ncbi:hypothetical protein COV17_04515 [Candidatus Woesearchaeota archaeon CG10_big_fil_rev_8_21_14_0_10_36_11]|nr:MAG: hypothetical protein COV17_04515 [Candidatus Woesearchaeota archaeon CG10_big_fil_rev_8_21_14_0_10_36_11]
MVRSIEGKHSEYYEAVLQLRDVTDNVMDFVQEEVVKARVHVTKTKKIKSGVDYYLSDNNFTRALGTKLQKQFGGQTIVTASIFGRKSGKEIYRLTVLFRGIPFKKDDVVVYKGDKYTVKIVGKDILLQDVTTGRKVHVKYKDMKNVTV